MNKKIKYSLLFIVGAFLILASFKIVLKIREKKQITEQIKKLPSFRFKSLDGNNFSKENISADMPLVVLVFNTDCDYCHYEIRELKKNITRLEKCQVLLVSSEERNKIRDFISVYDLDKYPQLKVLVDEEFQMLKYFGANTVPFTFIYNSSGDLVKEFKGEVKFEAILESLGA